MQAPIVFIKRLRKLLVIRNLTGYLPHENLLDIVLPTEFSDFK